MHLQGPGCCDHNHTERAANILTSLPYLAIGVDSYRCGLQQLQGAAAHSAVATPMYVYACIPAGQLERGPTQRMQQQCQALQAAT